MGEFYYVASKTHHGGEWVEKVNCGHKINSSWIFRHDEEIEDWSELWKKCIEEVSNASCLVIIKREGDELKGAWVELGAALAHGKRVFACGIDDYSIHKHPLIENFRFEEDAFQAAENWVRMEKC